MNYSVKACYFSGTGTTEKVVKRVAAKLGRDLGMDEAPEAIDFSVPTVREKPLEFKESDIVVFGMPVIAGRVPNLIMPYVKETIGGEAIAVPIVLYGNRNFDDALVELADLLRNAGMKVVAAAAFIGEHSFSKKLAAGRPDAEDLAKADKFAGEVALKLGALIREAGDGTIGDEELSKVCDFKIKGEIPYRFYYQPQDRNGKHIDIRKVKPKTSDDCIDCKTCVRVCPLGSIDYDDVSKIPGICMKCCACVKKCPVGAKYFDDEGYLYHMRELEDLYGGNRNEPEWFM